MRASRSWRPSASPRPPRPGCARPLPAPCSSRAARQEGTRERAGAWISCGSEGECRSRRGGWRAATERSRGRNVRGGHETRTHRVTPLRVWFPSVAAWVRRARETASRRFVRGENFTHRDVMRGCEKVLNPRTTSLLSNEVLRSQQNHFFHDCMLIRENRRFPYFFREVPTRLRVRLARSRQNARAAARVSPR